MKRQRENRNVLPFFNSDINVYSIEGKQINFTQSNNVIDISGNEKGVYLVSIDGVVMTEDLGEMDWYEAKKVCENLGGGWRLPTKDELNILYHNKDKIGGYTLVNYWSSAVGDSYTSWIQNFDNGSQVGNVNSDTNSVRTVRTF